MKKLLFNAIGVSVVLGAFFASHVFSTSWITEGNFSVLSSKKIVYDELPRIEQDCEWRVVPVRTFSFGTIYTPEMELKTENQRLCVTEGKSFSLATYESSAYVKVGDSNLFYRIYTDNASRLLHLAPNTNRVMYTPVTSGWVGYDLKVYDDFHKKLNFSFGLQQYVITDFDNPIYTSPWPVMDNPRLSSNGKWIVATVLSNRMFERVNVDTGETKLFGASYYPYQTTPLPAPSFAVADDGSKVIAGGSERLKTWDLSNSSCLVDMPADRGMPLADLCPYRMIEPQEYGQQIAPTYKDKVRILNYNDAASTITFAHMVGDSVMGEWNLITLRYPGYVEPQKGYDYLALGDSYASGQGDIENEVSSHYIAGTDLPTGCHISNRSYPYLLRNQWGFNDANSRSVACAGALMTPDVNSSIERYKGQNNEFASWGSENFKKLQTKAMNEFTPGVVPQVEFVKKYQPKFVTVMAGGNDVGFTDVLKYCAGGLGTCDYAKKNSKLNSILEASIQTQYTKTVEAIGKIREASPKTVIYLVGYPQFIASKVGHGCFSKVGAINNKESAAINRGVSKLNAVLKKAATTGAYYVDLENSLAGGKLCEKKSEYMTGLDALSGGALQASDADKGQAFHPSSTGHKKMAVAISAAYPNMSTDFTVPVPNVQMQRNTHSNSPAAFSAERLYSIKLDTASKNLKDATVSINLPAGTLKPASKAAATIYSHETKLGTYVAAKDGSLNIAAKLPKHIKAGEHVVTVEVTSASGQKIVYYNFVSAAGSSGRHYEIR